MKFKKGKSLSLAVMITDTSDIDNSYRVENGKGEYIWISGKFIENCITPVFKEEGYKIAYGSTPSGRVTTSTSSLNPDDMEDIPPAMERWREDAMRSNPIPRPEYVIRGDDWIVHDHPELSVGTVVVHRNLLYGTGQIISIDPGPVSLRTLASDVFDEVDNSPIRCHAPYVVNFPVQDSVHYIRCAGENLIPRT